MAKNFKISVQRNNGTLGIELIGDFDGTSACELLNVLEDNCRQHVRVVVNTTRVKEVYPFGVDTFNNNLYLLKNRRICLEFTGNRASTIAPERNTLFWASLYHGKPQRDEYVVEKALYKYLSRKESYPKAQRGLWEDIDYTLCCDRGLRKNNETTQFWLHAVAVVTSDV